VGERTFVSDSSRKEPRPFEPPPWERDAFERRAAEQAAREPLVEVSVPAESPEAGGSTAVAEPTEAEWAERELDALLRAPKPDAAAAAAPGAVPEAQIAAMLVGLRNEEPQGHREYTGVVNAVAGMLVVGGLALVIWAAVLLGGTGADGGWLGATTSALMMVWGLMLIGGAVLLWRKYNLRS
jgi:hypothetical protein